MADRYTQADREVEQLDEELANGEITLAEHARFVREIANDLREIEEEEARDRRGMYGW
ncbi:MAG: hypothetical protein ABFE13_11485 [Phycisphaerales bacterium]